MKTFEGKKRTTGAGVGDRTWNTADLPVLRKAAKAEKYETGLFSDEKCFPDAARDCIRAA